MRNRYLAHRDMARGRRDMVRGRDRAEKIYVPSAMGNPHEYSDHRDYATAPEYNWGDHSRGRDMRGDYRSDYRDYRYDMRYDMRGDYHSSKGGEEEYYEDLERWTEKLKRKDRFKVKKEEIISHAKQMGVRFEEFTEEEFYVVYLMMVSDFKAVANDFRSYLNMAKEWLMDDDIEVSPSEKLCIYYYEIVKGEGSK